MIDDKDRDFECSICTNLFFKPKLCDECETVFCKQCLLDSIQATGKFPHCQIENPKLTKPQRMYMNLLNKVKVKCGNCQMNDPITYEQLTKSHAKVCVQKSSPCPLGCGDILTSKEMYKNHYKQCKNSLTKCNFCSSDFLQKNLDDHLKVCGQVEIQCDHCQTSFKRLAMQTHLDECHDKEFSCQVCGQNIQAKDEGPHLEFHCLEVNVHCERCDKEIKKRDLYIHDCEVQIKCTNCHFHIAESYMEEHYKLCKQFD